MFCLKMRRRPTRRPFEDSLVRYQTWTHIVTRAVLPSCPAATVLVVRKVSFLSALSLLLLLLPLCVSASCACVYECCPLSLSLSQRSSILLPLSVGRYVLCFFCSVLAFNVKEEGSAREPNQRVQQKNGLGMMFQFFSLSLPRPRERESLVRDGDGDVEKPRVCGVKGKLYVAMYVCVTVTSCAAGTCGKRNEDSFCR